ncbi:MAG: peptide chain release factor N(5)-glutamine methyltransferase [Rhodobacteraceae bacterium]|nr:MAG: peptide chain release factor N(5)-glutamine methyltransferase [Paracoccaceae bacterium]
MTRAEAVAAATRRLAAAGVADPARDARLLMRHATGLDAAALSAALDAPLAEDAAARFDAAVARRAARAPLSHVTGAREFWGRRFAVGPEVLDPRPETEILIAWALEGPGAARVLDLGVGSGCILLTLLAEWPTATGVGVDASPAALAVAQANAAALGVAARAVLSRGDWCAGVEGRFDLVVANPPYLDAADMAALGPEERAEPPLALDGGADGLAAYRAIAAGLDRVLAPRGVALVEVGAGQAAAVAAIFRAEGFRGVDHREDFDHRVRTMRIARETCA